MEIVCSICGISGKMRSVFEVISPKGLILACEKCAFEEGFPILKIPDKRIFEESEKRGKVSEVMARLSGVKPRDQEKPELKRQEKNLREIVNKNYEEKMKMQSMSLKSRPDLVDKFHWIIMRVRRVKGLTQKQLAEAIRETEAAVKMAEQGIVPEGYGLIDKLERFLRVRLIKERSFHDPLFDKAQFLEKTRMREKSQSMVQKIAPQLQTQTQKTLSFDKQSLDSLTIADLQRIKKEREENRQSVVNLEREEEMWGTGEEKEEKESAEDEEE